MKIQKIARGSLAEIKSDAYLCLDCNYWETKDFKKTIDQIEKVEKLLNGLLAATKKQKQNNQ